MKNTRYNKLITAVAGLCLMLLTAGCQKTYDLELSLAVDAKDVSLVAAGGSTHVMVYATGDWDLSFAEPAPWASVNKTSGRGNSDFVFTYKANTGLSRKATLLLERDDQTIEIIMLQAAGEASPTLTLKEGNVMLIGEGLPIAIPLITNLYDDLPSVKTEVIYAEGDPGGWITESSLDMEKLSFTVTDNTTTDSRIAVIRLSISDANDEIYTTSTTVSQSVAAATLAFKDEQTLYDVAPSGEVLDLELDTNLSGYYPIRAIVEYGASSTNWLTAYKIDDSGLHLTVPANQDAQRSATFALAYTRKDGTEVKTSAITVTQDKEASKITFEALRQRVSTSEQIDDNLFIEGVVISDCTSENMEFNPNIDGKTVDMTPNQKTAYIQSTDGKYGFRLQFEKEEYNTLKRYDKLSLSIRKATVTCEQNPLRYTISDLKTTHLITAVAGSSADLVSKQKTIAQLTDEDLYTFVSLTDMEMAFKNGAYTNIYEPYSQKSDLNAVANPNKRADGWATPMFDARNNTIYMMINSLCQWRRTGSGVPKGIGTMNGILVHTSMPRYGDNLGTYQIRPIDEQDIALEKSPGSAFKTLVEWNWDNATPSLNFEKTGVSAARVANDRVLSDIGTGFLSTTTGGTIGYGADYNALDIKANNTISDRGIFKNGGVGFFTPANKWWDWSNNRGNSILIEFSSAAQTGRAMSLDFSFGAGDISAATSKDFPSFWQIEYSTDGVTFTKLDRSNITLRSVPWWEAAGTPVTSCEAGLGYTEHHIQLPASLLGQPKVVLRLSPANKTIATLDARNTASGTLTQTLTTTTAIRIGCLSIKYN